MTPWHWSFTRDTYDSSTTLPTTHQLLCTGRTWTYADRHIHWPFLVPHPHIHASTHSTHLCMQILTYMFFIYTVKVISFMHWNQIMQRQVKHTWRIKQDMKNYAGITKDFNYRSGSSCVKGYKGPANHTFTIVDIHFKLFIVSFESCFCTIFTKAQG